MKVDYILNSGDMTNIKIYDDEQINKESEENILQINNLLQLYHDKLYYIPGNHDSKNLFNNEYKIGNGVNVHKKVVELDSDLILCGFGGSVPAYHNGIKTWEGYPFNSEDEFKAEFDILLKEIDNHPNKFIFLMTHNGPSGSSTVVYQKTLSDKLILSGSNVLSDYLRTKDAQSRMVCNIHGHTHLGYGRTVIGKVQVINPGSLGENRFGILQLKRDSFGKWCIGKTEHIYLEN